MGLGKTQTTGQNSEMTRVNVSKWKSNYLQNTVKSSYTKQTNQGTPRVKGTLRHKLKMWIWLTGAFQGQPHFLIKTYSKREGIPEWSVERESAHSTEDMLEK